MLTPEGFARALVERLAPILPDGFVARAEEGAVHVDAPDGRGAATSLTELLDRDDLEPQDYADAAWAVLSLAQDVVSETRTNPWPGPIGGADDIPEPATHVEGRTVHLCFGPADQPTLRMAPIVLEPQRDS